VCFWIHQPATNDEETIIVALLCEEEERRQRRKQNRRRIWIHNIWRTRDTDGEIGTLFEKLLQDDTKFKIYFRMTFESLRFLHVRLHTSSEIITHSFNKVAIIKCTLSICIVLYQKKEI
jgi:hypothetical protein